MDVQAMQHRNRNGFPNSINCFWDTLIQKISILISQKKNQGWSIRCISWNKNASLWRQKEARSRSGRCGQWTWMKNEHNGAGCSCIDGSTGYATPEHEQFSRLNCFGTLWLNKNWFWLKIKDLWGDLSDVSVKTRTLVYEGLKFAEDGLADQNKPAHNGAGCSCVDGSTTGYAIPEQEQFSRLNQLFLGYFDPKNIKLNVTNEWI